MDKIVIRGGNPLLGTVRISGAKNAALPCMAAALLTDEPVILENIPQVRDIETTRKLLAAMGAEVELGYGRAHHRTTICARTLAAPEASYELVKTMRASTLVLGRWSPAVAARVSRCRVDAPSALALSISISRSGAPRREDHAGAWLRRGHHRSSKGGRLKGAEIVFDKITVTGTEDLLMAATLADGETVMQNCAREPEVADLAALLNAMGAKIHGAGTSTIRIKGVDKLHGARHRIIPDRIEAGTFIIAAALTGGDLNVAGCDPAHLTAILQKLAENGVKTAVKADSVRVMGDHPLAAADMNTEEYPGFPTDMQAQYMALATQAAGTSIVTENIFENASCTRRNWCAWAPTSRSKAAARSFAEELRLARLRSCLGPARLRLAGAGRPGRRRRNHHRPCLSPRPWLRKHRREAERRGRGNSARRQHLP